MLLPRGCQWRCWSAVALLRKRRPREENAKGNDEGFSPEGCCGPFDPLAIAHLVEDRTIALDHQRSLSVASRQQSFGAVRGPTQRIEVRGWD